jgi:5'-nucleotidase
VVGISSRALFDLAEANRVFVEEGLAAYRAYQRAHEEEVLAPGTAFPLVRGLLSINDRARQRLVEVIVISRNDAESAMRVFNSIEHYGLDITRGAFTNGGDSWRYIPPFHCSLFLSVEPSDVVAALLRGFAAALVLPPPGGTSVDEEPFPVRIAFDGDAVLFGGESERLFRAEGLEAFQEHERLRSDEPMHPGPFRPFLEALGRIQARFPEDRSPIRTALVTSRGAPAHRRVVTTLRSWHVRVDETFFLGGLEKAEVLGVLRPHIFFDDQMTHLELAAEAVPSAHVMTSEQLQLLPTGALPPPEPRARRPSRRGAVPAGTPPRRSAPEPAPRPGSASLRAGLAGDEDRDAGATDGRSAAPGGSTPRPEVRTAR